ncbi:MAG: tetratricopeptide repeat protein [Woeseiaceae bacterium]|nr:tetratricopeptide repeat protein [Woeseiaceae bacterium]
MQALVVAVFLFAAAGGDADTKTVIGPKNPALARGAEALLAGDAEEGIRLTEQALAVAQGSRERGAAYANLCAGYALIEEFETAIGYCDQALEETPRNWRALSNRALAKIELGQYAEAEVDLDRGQEIAPNATKLKRVRARLLDITDPVTPTITIDDRRDPNADEDDDEGV